MGSFAFTEGSQFDGEPRSDFLGLNDGRPSHAFRFRQRLSGTNTDDADPSPASSGEAPRR